MKNKILLVICGPTASGKTALAIELARHFHTEILSADSRQFFKETTIGTAKPGTEERKAVRHHFIDSLSITEEYNAGKFETDALELLNELYKRLDLVIMAGGSGLYIQAVCEGFHALPEADAEIREKVLHVQRTEGLEGLRNLLRKLDPVHYEKVDKANPHRMIRAIEVCLVTGKKYSELQSGSKSKKREFEIIKIGLDPDRKELYHRIDQRVETMMKDGLLEEARRLYPFRNNNALNTVGYKELFQYLDGAITLEEAVRQIQQNTRNFAKRQMTWWRKDPEIHWLKPTPSHSYKEQALGLLQKLQKKT